MRTILFTLLIQGLLYAHHKGTPHGHGGGKKVPEINGSELYIAILILIVVWIVFKPKKD